MVFKGKLFHVRLEARGGGHALVQGADWNDDGHTDIVYSDTYRGFVSNSLPHFWSEKVSKSYG